MSSMSMRSSGLSLSTSLCALCYLVSSLISAVGFDEQFLSAEQVGCCAGCQCLGGAGDCGQVGLWVLRLRGGGRAEAKGLGECREASRVLPSPPHSGTGTSPIPIFMLARDNVLVGDDPARVTFERGVAVAVMITYHQSLSVVPPDQRRD